MNNFELKTPSGIELFAQVMEPLATEPLVGLASASPIVGELLGENRMIFVSGHSQEPSLPHPRRVRLRRLALIRLPRSASAEFPARPRSSVTSAPRRPRRTPGRCGPHRPRERAPDNAGRPGSRQGRLEPSHRAAEPVRPEDLAPGCRPLATLRPD